MTSSRDQGPQVFEGMRAGFSWGKEGKGQAKANPRSDRELKCSLPSYWDGSVRTQHQEEEMWNPKLERKNNVWSREIMARNREDQEWL